MSLHYLSPMSLRRAVRVALETIESGRWEMCESLNHLSAAAGSVFQPSPVDAATVKAVIDDLGHVHTLIDVEGREDESYPFQCWLLRELVPFRHVSLDRAWLTSTVTALASQMYDSRDFSAMPILADALQDAGCTDEDILSHCRGPGPHARGCWVVDLILGKQ